MTETANPAAGAAAAATAEGPQVGLQKVFLKDVSFESPNAPGIFSGEWKPHYTLNMTTRTSPIGNDSYEVVLETTRPSRGRPSRFSPRCSSRASSCSRASRRTS